MSEDAEAEADEEEPLPEPGSSEIVLAERYRILPGSPLPELDQPGMATVIARDQRNPSDLLFARVCDAQEVPRMDMLENLRHMSEAHLLRPREWGLVDWPGGDQRRFAIVFQRPDHPPLMPSYKAKIGPMNSDDLSKRFLGSIIMTLAFFKQRGLTHRAIRPDNIYYSGPLKNTVILGDCASTPPAALQPVLFETIESGMTSPRGRGPGLMCNDFYALGVTILILSLGECPLGDLSDDEILDAKLSKGTYSALMGGRRPPFGLRELLRGLLSDDPLDRWGLEELEQWLGGSLRRSVQQHQQQRADRLFSFAGTEFGNNRALAHRFASHWESAYDAIKSPTFDKWLKRASSDPFLADQIDAVIQIDAEAGKQSGPSPRLVARVCAILDVDAPLRYKSLNTMLSGMGTSLASAVYRHDNSMVQVIAECIGSSAVFDWFADKPETLQASFEPELHAMKKMQQLLRHSGPGYGIERVLYMLNPYLPCLSPVLCGKNVVFLRNVLPTLEQVVLDRGSLPALVDRHMTAFIASRTAKNIDRTLATLEERKGNSVVGKLGMLNIFARLQSEFGPEALPYLTEWLARELEPALNQFKSKKRRRMLVEKLENVARGGDLVALNMVLNDEKSLRSDEDERRLAMRELSASSRQIAGLQSKEFHDSTQRTGWQIAAGVSMIVAASAMAVVTIW